MDITGTSSRDWRYVSEGGATIVLSYVGPLPQLGGKVLRLRKRLLTPSKPPSHFENPQEPDQDPQDDPLLAFHTKIVATLVPEEFLPVLDSAIVNESWLQEIAAFCDQNRPPERREKDCIDIKKIKAVLSTDLVGNEPLVVEIKPKWAFLPSPTHLSPPSREIKTKTCRFCMHSYLRSPDQETLQTGYCPLDLFSGVETRVTHAVRALWNAWVRTKGYSNNLRIFSRGKLVKPDDAALQAVIAVELLQITNHHTSDTSEGFVRALVPMLMNTSILHILSELQRTLDPLDIEGLSHLWRKAQDEANHLDTQSTSHPVVHPPFSGLSEPSITEWEAFIDVYLSFHQESDHSAPLTSDLRYYILAYLMSATFKDCSIMVRLGRESCTPHPITLIDLDPKSIAKFPEWEKLDKMVVDAYSGVRHRHCLDERKSAGST